MSVQCSRKGKDSTPEKQDRKGRGAHRALLRPLLEQSLILQPHFQADPGNILKKEGEMPGKDFLCRESYEAQCIQFIGVV